MCVCECGGWGVEQSDASPGKNKRGCVRRTERFATTPVSDCTSSSTRSGVVVEACSGPATSGRCRIAPPKPSSRQASCKCRGWPARTARTAGPTCLHDAAVGQYHSQPPHVVPHAAVPHSRGAGGPAIAMRPTFQSQAGAGKHLPPASLLPVCDSVASHTVRCMQQGPGPTSPMRRRRAVSARSPGALAAPGSACAARAAVPCWPCCPRLSRPTASWALLAPAGLCWPLLALSPPHPSMLQQAHRVLAMPPSVASAPGSTGKKSPVSLRCAASCIRVTPACTRQSMSPAFTCAWW